MSRLTRFAAIAAVCVVAQSQSFAQLQDVYIANSSGTIYQIDGQTLQATEVAQLQNAGTINEILYVGNGQLIANLTFGMVSYDFNTDTQTTLFTAQDANGEPGGISLLSGLAQRSDGDIYFTSFLQSPTIFEYSGTTYNPNTQEINIINGSPNNALYVDHFEISPDRMLGVVDASPFVDIFNPQTGVLETTLSLGITMTSFVESNGDLYILTRDGDIFAFDYTNGNTEFYGSITGTTGTLFGMTVPAPSSLGLLGLGLGVFTRRRRSA
jgi:outer membrane protein assembly factor BamB